MEDGRLFALHLTLFLILGSLSLLSLCLYAAPKAINPELNGSLLVSNPTSTVEARQQLVWLHETRQQQQQQHRLCGSRSFCTWKSCVLSFQFVKAYTRNACSLTPVAIASVQPCSHSFCTILYSLVAIASVPSCTAL